MKIVFKSFLIISFIFSFFLFLSKPIQAGTFSIPPLEEHHSVAYLNPNTEILYDQLAIVQTTQGIFSCKTNSSGLRFHAQTQYLYLKPWVSGYNCYDSYKWVAPNWVPQTSGQFLMDKNSTISANVYSPVTSYIDTIYTHNFGTNYGGLGTLSNGTFVLAEPNYSFFPTLAPPTANYKYYIEYRDNFVSTSWLRLEFNGSAYISSSYAVGDNLIGFDGDWALYETNGTQRALLDDSSSLYPPHLYISDIDKPCAAIERSNYVLIDDNGTAICLATVNPVIENIAPPYTGLIHFDRNAQDWGVFEWFEEVVVWFTDLINDVVGWFYGLWTNLLNLIIPNPDFFAFFGQDISNAFNEKIDIASFTGFVDDLNSLQDEEESEMPNLTGSLMGVEVPLIDFAIIKDNISIIRGITTTFVILYIAYFNINAITLILNNKKFLSRE